MNPRHLVISLLAVALSSAAGDVTGQAIITKRLTKKAIASPVYNLRGTTPPAAAPENAPANEFENTIVMLEGGTDAPKTPPITATIEQRHSRFEPELLVIPVGSTVQFPNFDPIFHNVFSLSKTEPFDLGFYPLGKSRSVKFNRSGIVQVYCHIHANMYAAIVVASSPWYGKPAADGSFSFHDVPAGHYRVVAWHKVAGLHQTEVDVPETGTAEVSIHIPFDVEPHR